MLLAPCSFSAVNCRDFPGIKNHFKCLPRPRSEKVKQNISEIFPVLGLNFFLFFLANVMDALALRNRNQLIWPRAAVRGFAREWGRRASVGVALKNLMKIASKFIFMPYNKSA